MVRDLVLEATSAIEFYLSSWQSIEVARTSRCTAGIEDPIGAPSSALRAEVISTYYAVICLDTPLDSINFRLFVKRRNESLGQYISRIILKRITLQINIPFLDAISMTSFK